MTGVEPGEWRLSALCRSGGVDMFGRDVTELRRICAACPVRVECLAYAMDRESGLRADHRAGMWGGRTPQEREALDGGRPASGQLLPIDHGSSGGAAAHRRRGERPCTPCLRTEARDTAARKARRPVRAS